MLFTNIVQVRASFQLADIITPETAARLFCCSVVSALQFHGLSRHRPAQDPSSSPGKNQRVPSAPSRCSAGGALSNLAKARGG